MNSSRSYFRTATLLSLIVVGIRLLTLNFPDLVDTTEGRYAGVAKIMLERDDWVTPWLHYRGEDKPYLGKPPLHFWLMQTAYLVFGQNNFAARFPSVVSTVGIGVMVWIGASALLGAEAAVVGLSVLGSSCMVFFLGGAVVLDMTLTLGITTALISFLLADRRKLFGYLFFLGMAVGVLVKGPLACVLTLGIIAPWALLVRYQTGSWPSQLRHIPFLSGTLLFLSVVIPWYWWAEIRNPGFLRYFLINENFGRYLKSDYGDVYGSGHTQPFGTAWGMMILAIFPWSIIALACMALLWKSWRVKTLVTSALKDPILLFALCWTFSCPTLLLGARQYTATYLCPSLPGFALLAAVVWRARILHNALTEDSLRRCLYIAAFTLSSIGIIAAVVSIWYQASPLIVCISVISTIAGAAYVLRQKDSTQVVVRLAVLTTLIFGTLTFAYDNYISANRSSRRLLERAASLVPGDAPIRIGFAHYFPFSARFYAPEFHGRKIETYNLGESSLSDRTLDLIIARKRNVDLVLKERPGIQEVGTIGHWHILRPY